MSDSIESLQQGATGDAPWLLLIHKIPPKPDYLRVKFLRWLRRIGARALKNSVYILPNNGATLEDFQWLQEAIIEAGGYALVCEASFVGRDANEEVSTMFEVQRTREVYHRLTWITRRGVKVDRIACAWLIQRFLDPEAKFQFIDPKVQHLSTVYEQTFDIVGADWGHRGEFCTFEHFVAELFPNDRALRVIGEIVHDIDLKDDKFRRPETTGIAQLLRAIVETEPDDLGRIDRGAPIFNELYTSLR